MKIIHTSDLHIGKRANGFSMLEDQEYILEKIVAATIEQQADCLLIAGDVYDKAVPPGEAVQLFDDFLYRLTRHGIKVLVISGNHDSPERIAFGSRMMNRSGVYLSPVYGGKVEPVTLTDQYGSVDFFLLPFIKPSHVRRFYPEEEPDTYTAAMATAIRHMPLNPENRSVLVTHQFVTGALRCDSEDISVGGSDNVDAAVFAPFDYVALGHLHGPQKITRDTIRYCGTPLKYSFSEVSHKKSLTVIDLLEKGVFNISTLPLTPKRDWREIRGAYMDITAKSYYQDMDTGSYFRVTLTDELDIPDAIGKLRTIYPNIMELRYDNRRARSSAATSFSGITEKRQPSDYFSEFYQQQNSQPMTPEQDEFVAALIEKIWEGSN